MKNLFLRSLVITSLSILIAGVIWLTGITEEFERVTWDARVKNLAESTPQQEKIILILVDQDSLDWGNSELGLPWPWPRQVLSPIVDYVKEGGAKSIGFDVIYSGASTYYAEDDEIFSNSIRNSGIFNAALFLHSKGEYNWNPEIPDQSLKIEGLDNWIKKNPLFKEFSSGTFPIPEIAQASDSLGVVQAESDEDGIFRDGNIFSKIKNHLLPSLALATYLTGENKGAELKIVGDSLFIGEIRVPLNSEGKSVINYRPSGKFTKLKAAAVIESSQLELEGKIPIIDKSIFKDSYVLFGYSAPGLFDLRPSPISETTPGVEIHGNILENILSNSFIVRLSIPLALLIAIILSYISSLVFTKFQGAIRGVILFLLFISLPILLAVWFYKAGIWFPLIFIELTLILALLGSGVVNYAIEGRQKRYIKQAFKQYLNPAYIEHLLESPEKLKLGGERKEISIFFSDLEGFTAISEALSPEDLTNLLNRYLTAMTNIIQDEGGTIDKYEGDAIIAFWNAPLDCPDHAIRAVRASIRCQQKLDELRPLFYKETGFNLHMRIGINTGEAVVGNLGSDSRFDYTMLGDSVNLAARLEGINKQFGTYTLISESTQNAIENSFPTREISRVKALGKTRAITVYEPMGVKAFKEKQEIFGIFSIGLKEYYLGNFKEAIVNFRTISKEDSTARLYLKRCYFLLENNMDSDYWDGVWEMNQK